MKLQDQVMVVTGAHSGMGAATATLLSEFGAKVALVDLQRADELAKKIKGYPVVCDVSDAVKGEEAIQAIVKHFGKITGCINCAGVATAARLVGRDGPHDLAQYTRTIQINLIGTFNMMRLCAAQMIKQTPENADGERGVIVNTASVAAFEGQIGQVAYSASKGGIVSMTLPAARELSKFGIRVMTIAPGIIDTPMMAGMPESVQSSLAESVTFPKRLGNVNEYAQLVKFIFENAYLNGSVIRLDGAIRMTEK
ncbi:MAG: 3-hydroxy-2-methylbutyryl-CoA dehydrogenase [Coxiella sp. RIFCSPHIGHO2_12_FULL_42_15]|nr:MAG: 3-hydroxy-2-methylbutyryl-CoA dehydrogenase [Coxiella sp. RIFCSPHIGHO2_12_FULL_42_15]